MKLRYPADRRSLAFLALYYAFFLGSWMCFLPHFSVLGFEFWPQNYAWLFVLAVVLLGALNFMVAITIHNSIHCPIFVEKHWNKWHRVALTLAFGAPASGYVPGHNLSHHKHLQTAKDNTRTHKMRFRWNFLNQLLFFFVMIPGILRTEGRFAREIGPKKPSWFKQYRLEIWLSWVWKLVFLAWNWKLALWLLVLPNLYAVWGIFGTNFWQHDGCDETHPYNHSRNFVGSWFNFLVCNNGYHGAHHMRPALHWSLYPAFHKEHIAAHIHPELDQKSLLLYLWKSLIWPGRRINYLGQPLQLPAKMKDQDWVTEAGKRELSAEDMGQVTA